MTPLKDSNIILIGPSGGGKSTLGKLLGEKLRMPWLELDDLRWAYHDEMGYDREKASRLRREQGFDAVVAYWEPFTIYSLERTLEDYPAGHLISTGAGAVVFDHADYRERVKKALQPHPFVVLVLPSPDVDDCIRICTARIMAENPEMRDAPPGGPLEVNAGFIRRRAYHDLATITVYNSDQTPEQTCKVIIEAMEQGL